MKIHHFIYGVISLSICLPVNVAYAQTCNDSITNEWPNSRYTDHGNGTVTDTATGLMWMQCSEGQSHTSTTCEGSATTHNWQAALELASNKSFVSHSDWRLPNVKELASLAARNCYTPSINEALFPNTPSSRFWSSSPYANFSYYAWVIYFNNGSVYLNNRNNNYRVRLVR